MVAFAAMLVLLLSSAIAANGPYADGRQSDALPTDGPYAGDSRADSQDAEGRDTYGRHAEDAGLLEYTIRDDSGELMPGKLVFLQDGDPVDIRVPYDGGLTATYYATLYTASGAGSISLPAGSYEVWAGRGLEYSADVHRISLEPGETVSLEANLRREVDTPGFISADMHVHVENVEHLEERVISIVGEGLEWAVSTEHNVHIDYSPAIQKLGLGDHLLTTVGNEVTTSIGHFNVFPVDPDAKPVDHRLMDAHELFARMRAGSDDTIIQVNHPRWDGGAYFTYMGVSPASGLTIEPSYSEDFDSYELLNENRGFGWTAEPPNNSYSVRDDWYHLLNRGIRKPVFGNSDSHSIAGMLVGLPRNYVASSTDDPAAASQQALRKAIREGRVSVNRGLYVEAYANAGGVGDLVPLRDGEVRLRVRVQAPGWIDCRSIQVVANGSVVAALEPTSEAGVRLDTTLTFRPERDTWYVVTAEGSAPMRPLIHDAPVPITPLGVTNAIWADADEDGRFTPMYDDVAAEVERGRDNPAGLVSRLAGHPDRLAFALGYVLAGNVNEPGDLIEVLLPHAPPHERLLTYRRLAEIGTEKGLSKLEDAADSAFERIDRAAAALELAKLGREPYVTRMMALVRELDTAEIGVLDFSGFERGRAIVDWRVVGPFPFDGAHGLDDVHEVEEKPDPDATYTGENGAALTWTPARAAANGLVDLTEHYGTLSNTNAYAQTKFEAAAAGDVLLLLGSDDGVVLWLNGEERHRNDAHRSADVGDDVLLLPVQKGTNTILLKVENGSGDWGFGAELVDLANILQPRTH